MNDSISRRRLTESRLLVRSCEALLGIAAGLIADGELNDSEIVFLSTWLAEHSELVASWPGEVVYNRVREVLADGVITNEERAHLALTLAELIGGNFKEDGSVPAGSTSLPIDADVSVDEVSGRSFCFTGQFLYGTRARCERAVAERGGKVSPVGRDLDFLVIGELASRDWKYSSHGMKIESAMNARRAGSLIKIIGETQWSLALGDSSKKPGVQR